jgi:hypothetical protein
LRRSLFISATTCQKHGANPRIDAAQPSNEVEMAPAGGNIPVDPVLPIPAAPAPVIAPPSDEQVSRENLARRGTEWTTGDQQAGNNKDGEEEDEEGDKDGEDGGGDGEQQDPDDTSVAQESDAKEDDDGAQKKTKKKQPCGSLLPPEPDKRPAVLRAKWRECSASILSAIRERTLS